MGILKEMFGSEDESYQGPVSELLADGEYESRAELILRGYKVFRKKYVYGSLVWKMLLVALAVTSSVMMIMNSQNGEIMPFFCLLISVGVGVWFISQPISNTKKLKSGLDVLEGAKYRAEIFTDKIKISSLDSPELACEPACEPAEETENNETEQTKTSGQTEADIALDGEKNEIPASVIHLDSYIVDLIEKEDMFVLVVKKAYVFIIPKSAFSECECEKVREKLSVIMGIRYKIFV